MNGTETPTAPGPLPRVRALLDALKPLGANLTEIDYEVRTVEALADWALTQAGIDYREGDTVRIAAAPVVGPDLHGWYCYREALHEGAACVVRSLHFQPTRGRWEALVAPVRLWSVHDGATYTERFWYGPPDDRPEGMTLASKPMSRSFVLPATTLQKVTQ